MLHAGAHDVERDQDRDDRIEPLPAGERDAAQTPTMTPSEVQTSLIRWCASASRVMDWCRRAGAEEHPGDEQVDDRGRDRDPDAKRELLDRLGGEQPADRGVEDARGGEHDERALEAAGEVLRLAVAVAVVLVLRPRRRGERDERHDGRGQVDQRLERVGQQADRPGDGVGAALEPDRGERRQDRDDGVAAERAALFRHVRQPPAAASAAPRRWSAARCPRPGC